MDIYKETKEDNIDNKRIKKKSIVPKDIPLAEGSSLPFGSKAFSDAWFSWLDYRKEIKKALKPSTIESQFKQFILWGEQKSVDSIKNSITNGWTGLFEPRQQYKKPLTDKDHNNGF